MLKDKCQVGRDIEGLGRQYTSACCENAKQCANTSGTYLFELCMRCLCVYHPIHADVVQVFGEWHPLCAIFNGLSNEVHVQHHAAKDHAIVWKWHVLPVDTFALYFDGYCCMVWLYSVSKGYRT